MYLENILNFRLQSVILILLCYFRHFNLERRTENTMKQTIAVVTTQKSDFSLLLETLPNFTVEYILPQQISAYDLSIYAALVLLGGTEKSPLALEAEARIKIEEQIQNGKKVFSEYLNSIDDIYTPEPASTRFKRLIVNQEIAGLSKGDILEDQCNSFVLPHFSKKLEEPILYYKEFIGAHDKTDVLEEDVKELSNWALWKERPNLMVCSFRLCNFIKARFAPIGRWKVLICSIIEWLTGESMENLPIGEAYTLIKEVTDSQFDSLLKECFASGIRWFHESKMLIQNGRGGIYEGFMTEIQPDGSQARASAIRTDCTAEASLAFFADYLLNGNMASLKTSDELEAFCYEKMQIKGGLYDGMIRWTNIAWNVCYQDDNARVMIPSLLKMMYTGNYRYLNACCKALDFLVKTTGPDGLRPSRTDNFVLDEAEIQRLHTTPANFPCAHYNAFYSATLLLCGKLAKRDDFIEVGIKGLESIMAVYPKTVREQSETQELCRLILPLAWLYWVTGNPKHKDYLYRVTNDLQKMKHPSGAYLEWDSDYSAACSQKENAECSLLTKNGDPITDLLYSLNWLPLGFSHAYLITGDSYFYGLWKEISSFMIRSQIHSDNSSIDGGWARGFDVDRMEVYGLPNDVGWGPWAIESGWTVSEILAGLGLGLLDKNIFHD